MNIPNYLFSLFIAVIVFSTILGVFSLSPVMFLYVAVLTTVFSGALALPVILLLHKFEKLNIYTTLFFGFLIGAIPFGFYFYPQGNPELSTNASSSIFGNTMANGITTSSGWLAYSSVTLIFGFMGLLFAAIFWSSLIRLKSSAH